MSNRSWFYAANGQQQGPFPEAQLRDLITRGTVRADTLVWSEGMPGWQRAGEIPGLIPAGSAPPSIQQPGGPPPMGAGGAYAGNTVEKNMKKVTVYDVRVRMDNGNYRHLDISSAPAVGSRVIVEGSNLRMAN